MQPKSVAFLLVVFISILSSFSLKLLSPPEVVPSAQGDEKFSAERALLFLSVVAQEPHSPGSTAHTKVRDYIFTYCERMGLETQLMDETGMNIYPNSIRAGSTQNILARLKGSEHGKTILVMGHYDSQPNTPAASDDGAGVAAMMESIRLLKNFPPLKNDILFLFTDQEETGLLGAESFVSQYKDLNEIGLILNFEARGNAGVSFTFEVSKQNGWMMREYSQAIKQPFANSFAYEIYKVMPNDTDFSRFRNTGITGFNSAFIDGYSYYHSPADKIENMDVRSLQHHGEILFQSLQHFGNISIENTKGEDAIFFNPAGSVLWIYPLSWDVPLMMLTFVLWIALVVIGYMRGRLKTKFMFAGLGLFFGSLAMSGVLVWGVFKFLVYLYPHYTNFYSSNFYNATDYFLVIEGIVLLSFMLLFKKAALRNNHESVLMGSVLAMILLMVGVKFMFNTGAYLIYYPLLVLLIVFLFLFLSNSKRENQPALYGLSQLVLIAPAILLWLPMAYVIYIAFSLVLPFGAIVMLSFCIPFLFVSLGYVQLLGKKIVLIFPLILIFWGLISGHLHSRFDKRHPLQSELMYAMDLETNKAYWVSTQNKLDEWNRKYFPNATAKENLDDFYPGAGNSFWKSSASIQNLSKGKISIIKDSVANGKRILKINARPDSACYGIRIYFFNEVEITSLNNRKIESGKWKEGQFKFLQFIAPSTDGVEIELRTDLRKLDLQVIEQRLGLPSAIIPAPLPENFIYSPNYFSNTTQVKYKVAI
jgi:hypothetical protein